MRTMQCCAAALFVATLALWGAAAQAANGTLPGRFQAKEQLLGRVVRTLSGNTLGPVKEVTVSPQGQLLAVSIGRG